MRPLVSYDDITLPYQPQSPLQLHSQSLRPPPPKKQKSSHQRYRQKVNYRTPLSSPRHVESGTDRNDTPSSVYVRVDNKDLQSEDSRELTHEEIWDDSALIEAWNAATEEYEAYNGPDKGWKSQPLHKSSLWYNVPPTLPKKDTLPEIPSEATVGASRVSILPQENGGDASVDSHPLDFETFIPTHDPSLNYTFPLQPSSVPWPDYPSQSLPDPPGPPVSQDEAFARALGAMYWGGYWTAVYHCQRTATPMAGDTEAESEDEAEEEEEFVSTQR